MNTRLSGSSFRPLSWATRTLLMVLAFLLFEGQQSQLYAIATTFSLGATTTCPSLPLTVTFAGAGYNQGNNCINHSAGPAIDLELEDGVSYSGTVSCPSSILITQVDVNISSFPQCYYVSINGGPPGPNGSYSTNGLSTTSYAFTVQLVWPRILVNWDSCSTDGANTLLADG